MKKYISVIACLMAVLALVFCLSACGSSAEEPETDISDIAEEIETPVAEVPIEEETPAEKTSAETTSDIRPEFKEAMDSYEAFYDEYCAFMKKYTENPTDMTLLGEYASMMSKSAEMTQKFDAWNSEDLSEAELTYYLEVSSRVTQKMLECVQ